MVQALALIWTLLLLIVQVLVLAIVTAATASIPTLQNMALVKFPPIIGLQTEEPAAVKPVSAKANLDLLHNGQFL
jgi:hypothetical protein